MTRSELVTKLRAKKSLLCVGLDTDPAKLPVHLQGREDGVLAFNRQIVDATREYAVAYKLNTAFYEAQGIAGWQILEETRRYIGNDVFTIADAKRGDIGNTSEQYARTFFETFPFDSVTIAPYMGADSVQPFLKFSGKWGIVLGLTSNAGSADFQQQTLAGGEKVFEKVLRTVASWGTPDNIMFVIGATKPEGLAQVRALLPDHFFLVPGVGAQGGDVDSVCQAGCNAEGGLLINVSRGICSLSTGEDFADKAREAARDYQQQMTRWL